MVFVHQKDLSQVEAKHNTAAKIKTLGSNSDSTIYHLCDLIVSELQLPHPEDGDNNRLTSKAIEMLK